MPSGERLNNTNTPEIASCDNQEKASPIAREEEVIAAGS